MILINYLPHTLVLQRENFGAQHYLFPTTRAMEEFCLDGVNSRKSYTAKKIKLIGINCNRF